MLKFPESFLALVVCALSSSHASGCLRVHTALAGELPNEKIERLVTAYRTLVDHFSREGLFTTAVVAAMNDPLTLPDRVAGAVQVREAMREVKTIADKLPEPDRAKAVAEMKAHLNSIGFMGASRAREDARAVVAIPPLSPSRSGKLLFDRTYQPKILDDGRHFVHDYGIGELGPPARNRDAQIFDSLHLWPGTAMALEVESYGKAKPKFVSLPSLAEVPSDKVPLTSEAFRRLEAALKDGFTYFVTSSNGRWAVIKSRKLGPLIRVDLAAPFDAVATHSFDRGLSAVYAVANDGKSLMQKVGLRGTYLANERGLAKLELQLDTPQAQFTKDSTSLFILSGRNRVLRHHIDAATGEVKSSGVVKDFPAVSPPNRAGRALASDGTRLLIWEPEGSKGSRVTHYQTETLAASGVIRSETPIDHASFSPDGRFVLVAGPTNDLRPGESQTYSVFAVEDWIRHRNAHAP